MSDQFLGEIRVFSFNYAPKFWAMCNGQSLPVNQNQALFSLLGTSFGGNGQTTFNLPNLQGRVPVHFTGALPIGAAAGEANHTLLLAEIPSHTHSVQASSQDGDVPVAGNALLASPTATPAYGPATSLVQLASATVVNAGGGQPHSNMQPYLALTFCIALSGIFPSRN